jgi:hypothetical protein
MIEISIALVIIACIAGWLFNKHMDINNKPSEEGTIAALEERINKFDQRINDTWSNTSTIKQELDALKLQIGIRGR